MVLKARQSPSGAVVSIARAMAIASTAVATTAAATATGSFSGARVGDIVSLSPQANLTASVAIAFARVATTNIIVVGFTNVGASTAQAAVTFDTCVQRKQRNPDT